MQRSCAPRDLVLCEKPCAEDPAQDPHGIADRYDRDLKGEEVIGGGNEQGAGIGGKSGVNPEL